MRWIRDGKKKELWEMDKNVLQRFKINMAIAIRKFNRETKGLGILFLLVIIIFVFIQFIPYLIPPPTTEETKRAERIARCIQYNTCVWGVYYG